ncbi:hypothetical protein [Klebsiella pneumoniae]|uniref:hypothetical protein n=1 Tax=Klebsiella pneumoniae TaxID=573 RepID=UPI0027BA3CB8|nr:hypothetical protein [Klebsiella pneumoniae]HCB0886959.1 hypothetical protein [Klebsiella pneumoniae]HEI8995478.1 hypothetical protein [Klebsiella pneumoniae]
MTDITELAQSHELLIANGQQTADLLRHLADNEIDSDYFAVVSECESYGQETDTELSITEFALRAAGYVDELVEALEKAQQVDKELCKLLPPGAEYMDPPDGGDVEPIEQVRRMVADFRQRIAELESRTVKLPDLRQIVSGDRYVWSDGVYNYSQDVKVALAAAGIKVEAE